MIFFSKSKAISIDSYTEYTIDNEISQSLQPIPKVYISYVNKDKYFINSILKMIEGDNYDIIYYDQYKLNEDITRRDLIESSDSFIVFMSRDYFKSSIADYEIALIKENLRSRSKFILGMLEKTELYEVWKRNKLFADFSKGKGLNTGVSHIKARLNNLYP